MTPVNNNKLVSFDILPTEITSNILSRVDLQTLFNIALSFVGNSYQISNEFAETILDSRFITKIENGDSYVKQLFDYSIKSLQLLNTFFNKNYTQYDLSEFKNELTNNPGKINKATKDLLTEDKPDEDKFKLLIDNGAKIELCDCLRCEFSHKTIKQVLIQKAYVDDISLFRIDWAIKYKYPENIIKLMIDNGLSDSKRSALRCFYLSDIVSTPVLSEKIIIEIINKTENFFFKDIYMIVKREKGLSESIVLALLDKVDPAPGIDAKTIQNLNKFIWDKVTKEKFYSFEVLKKLIDLYTSAKVPFNLEQYQDNILYRDIDFYKNEELINSLIKNNATFTLKFLEMAVKNNVSPELIFDIYVKIGRPQKGEPEPYRELQIRMYALNYMFNSNSFKLIYDLNELGEYPGWETVGKAICQERGESLINLLLDAYEKEESRPGGTCSFHYSSYSNFLDDAVKFNGSQALIKRILDKTTQVWERTLKNAIKRNLPDEIIQKMQELKTG